MAETHRIFVAYCRDDVAIAGAVMTELTQAGAHVWAASSSLGQDWVDSIERGMADSSVFLPIVTDNFLRSSWCTYELGFALQLQRAGALTIVPVIVSDTTERVPPTLSRKHELIDGRGLKASTIADHVMDQLKALPIPPLMASAEA